MQKWENRRQGIKDWEKEKRMCIVDARGETLTHCKYRDVVSIYSVPVASTGDIPLYYSVPSIEA